MCVGLQPFGSDELNASAHVLGKDYFSDSGSGVV